MVCNVIFNGGDTGRSSVSVTRPTGEPSHTRPRAWSDPRQAVWTIWYRSRVCGHMTDDEGLGFRDRRAILWRGLPPRVYELVLVVAAGKLRLNIPWSSDKGGGGGRGRSWGREGATGRIARRRGDYSIVRRVPFHRNGAGSRYGAQVRLVVHIPPWYDGTIWLGTLA